MIIRKATAADAAEIANVHISSWREAYKGLLPQEFLDDRPLYFKNRYELWKKMTVNPSQVTYVAECPENGVVGFINGEYPRDLDFKDHAEVWCIYLLKKYHGKKIGFQLLKAYFDIFSAKGFSKGYLWVIRDNPTIKFYESTGGKFSGLSKKATIQGQEVEELCFVWDKIKF